MVNRFRARGLSLFLALLGCSSGVSEGNGSRSGASGSAGVTGWAGGTAGSAAPSAAAGSGGALASASAGSPSSPRAGGGGNGSAGSAAGGATSSAGALGGSLSAGTGGTSASGGNGGAAPAPTFTQIYDTIITPSCGGTQCHLKRPTPYGYDFSSKSAASTSWRSDVFPGDAANSPMFQVLDFGIMPKGKPPLSIAQLYLVYDWINAGALDN